MPRRSACLVERPGITRSTRHNREVGRNFTDRRVEVDGHGRFARSGPQGPGAGQQRLSDRVELAHVTKGNAA